MIVDTSAWVDFIRATGSPTHLRLQRALLKRERVLLLDVVYQEILQGARSPTHFLHLQAQLDSMLSWAPDDARELARQAAMLYARCRWQGLTIRSPNDCLVAACAVEAGEPLLHADRDFESMATVEPRLKLL
jgi:predicted nucleic acid-binding protein